jgi:small-conductance mechanosensitive channel
MNSISLVSIALVIGGIALIVFGVSASNSLSSDVSRFFTGSPTDKAVWLLVGGAAASVAGTVGLFLGSKRE